MSDIKEIASSLKDVLLAPVIESIKFRAKNNFFGSFILSWIFWNWEKLAYFIFSKDEILKKIKTVKLSSPFEDDNQWHIFAYSHSLFLPLISAIIFTFSYPFFAWFISYIHKWILNQVHVLHILNEIQKQKSNKALIRAQTESENEKDIVKGQTELRISVMKKKSAEINYNIGEITSKYASLKNEMTTLELKKQELNSTVSALESKHQSLTLSLQKITAENTGLLELQDKYSILLSQNRDLSAERDKLNHNYLKAQEKITQLEHDMGRNYQHFEPLYNELVKEQSSLKDTIKRLDTFIDSNSEIKRLMETSKTFNTLISDIIKISK